MNLFYLIATTSVIVFISTGAGWFARDYQYWKYDHVKFSHCVPMITDSEVEGLK